jgi:hypothetical protein
VGSTQAAHLASDARVLDEGPLPQAQRKLLEELFALHGESWRGVI